MEHVPDVNARVEMVYLNEDDEQYRVQGRVDDLDGEDLLVSVDARFTRSLAPSDESRLSLLWLADDVPVEIPVEFKRARREPRPTWVLRPLGPPVQRQRRDAFRLAVSLPTKAAWRAEAREATLQDLSATGARVTLDAPAPERGERLRLRFELDGTAIDTACVVVRRIEVENRRLQLGLAFADLDEPDGDFIHGFLVAEQLRARRRERGLQEEPVAVPVRPRGRR